MNSDTSSADDGGDTDDGDVADFCESLRNVCQSIDSLDFLLRIG